MKIISKKLNKELIVVQVETLDDLWTLYNLIAVGDQIDGKTSRRVVLTDRPEDKGERRMIFLKIVVEQVEFHEFSNRLRAKGKIIEGPEDLVRLHSYHTFNIEEYSKIGITKDRWTRLHLNVLTDASKNKITQKILAIAIDSGEATFAEIGDYYQKTSVRISETIPGKRFGDVKDSVNAQKAFFAEVMKKMDLMRKQNDYTKIVITGPGFTREHYVDYCIKKDGNLKSLMITESASSATNSGIHELLRKETIQKLLKDSRIIEETNLVEEFFARLGKDSGDFAYGLDDLKEAAEIGAIENLLLTDEMMRKINHEKDKNLLDLLQKVEKNGGKITIMSTLHDSGKKIKGMGGMVALLRFRTKY